MKKIFSLIWIFVFCLVLSSHSFADTYFYGIVYHGVSTQNQDEPWDDPNGRYVSYAVVHVYNSSNNYVKTAMADSCGYFEVTLSSADDYRLVVANQTYDLMFQDQCWIMDYEDNLAGSTELTWLWYAPKELNIFTY